MSRDEAPDGELLRRLMAQVVHQSAIGGEWTLCGQSFVSDMKRTMADKRTTCPLCLDVIRAAREATEENPDA